MWSSFTTCWSFLFLCCIHRFRPNMLLLSNKDAWSHRNAFLEPVHTAQDCQDFSKAKKGERNVPSKCRTIQRQGCCGIWDVCMKFSAETGMHKAPVKERSVRWIQRAGGQTCIIDLSSLGMFLKYSLDIYKKQYDQSWALGLALRVQRR